MTDEFANARAEFDMGAEAVRACCEIISELARGNARVDRGICSAMTTFALDPDSRAQIESDAGALAPAALELFIRAAIANSNRAALNAEQAAINGDSNGAVDYALALMDEFNFSEHARVLILDWTPTAFARIAKFGAADDFETPAGRIVAEVRASVDRCGSTIN